MRTFILAGALFAVTSPAFAQVTPNQIQNQTYYEFQVETVAKLAKDTGWPVYPEGLKFAKIEGEVRASFVVDTLGMVDSSSFKVLKATQPQFADAVRAGLSKMRFEPARIGGRKVKQYVQVPFMFQISVPNPAPVPVPAPCTTPTTACEQWVTFGGGPARSMTYSTHSLSTPNSTVTRALIMVHGTNRNADHYFETATAAAFLAGALDNTVVLAPHIIIAQDKPQQNEVAWPDRGDTWRSGGMSTSHPTLSSFDFVDEIVRRLADKKTFPNLRQIVVTGHSAGGQFATRYEMANKVHGTAGVTITYVVANPSSYAWPAAVRPLPTGDADPTTADKEAVGPNGEKVNGNFTFGPFDTTTNARAANYNRWPAGLENRKGYTEKTSDDQLKKQLVERPTTYLLGQVDVLPLGGFDSSPTAMAQGPTRRARGEAFFKYVTETMGAKHQAVIVPECGHNDRCIFTTNIVFPFIFPKG